jgi:elongation factor Ts
MVDAKKLKQLREETGAPFSDCQEALEKSDGDIEKAKEILREKGKEVSEGKSGRDIKAGIIESYIHQDGKVGVLLKLCSESDFVAKSEDFKILAHEICLQIAAMKPIFVSEEDIPEAVLEKEKDIYKKQMEDSDKPEDVINQIIEGKLKKYKERVSILDQAWIKDDKKTIKDLISEYNLTLGEKIEISQFVRLEI